MTADYELVLKDHFVRVIFHGKQDFVTTNQAIADAAQLAKQAGIKSVMFDFRLADPRGYFAETVRHGEIAPGLGLSVDFRIALYSPSSFDAIDFMETVAQNRGYTARAFRREEEAVKWLTSVDQG